MPNNKPSVFSYQSSDKTKKGFTLVELLVVVAIIAILSLVGITIYTSTLKNARDAKRRSDIDSIAKALEVNKRGNKYTQLSKSFFSSVSIPVDETTTKYCMVGGSGVFEDPSSWADEACPTLPIGYTEIVQGDVTFDLAAWKICAKLESSTGGTNTAGLKVYCRGSTL